MLVYQFTKGYTIWFWGDQAHDSWAYDPLIKCGNEKSLVTGGEKKRHLCINAEFSGKLRLIPAGYT